MLRGYKDWDEQLAKVTMNYNNTVHSETGLTPSQMILTKPHDMKAKFMLDDKTAKTGRLVTLTFVRSRKEIRY